MAAARGIPPPPLRHDAARRAAEQLLALTVIFLATALLRLPVWHRTVLDWDESLYALMAGQWLAGHLPYTTIWDNKPIGIYAIFAVFQAAFRDPVRAIRAATLAAVALTAFGLWRLAPLGLSTMPPPARGRLAALAAAAFIVASLSNDGLAANTEIFMECFSVHAVLAAMAPGGGAWRRGFTIGLLFGLACMTKYVAVFEAPAMGFVLLSYRNKNIPHGAAKTICAAAAGASLPPAVTVLTYALTGHLALWWQCSIIANIARVSTPVSAAQLHQAVFVFLPHWLPLSLAAVILFAAAPAAFKKSADPDAGPRRKFHAVVMLWLAGGMLGVASAKSFYDHYFLQILPPLCLALVVVLAHPACRVARAPRAAFLTLAAGLLAIPAVAGQAALAATATADTPARIAASLRPAIAAGFTLYVFDSQPILYALTGATPPTRYVFPSVLTKCALEKVAGIDAAREVAAILARHPDFIVRNPYPPGPGANASVYGEVAESLAADYKVWRQYPGAVVYERRPGALQNAVPSRVDSCRLQIKTRR